MPRPRKISPDSGEMPPPVLRLPAHLLATIVPSLPKTAQVYDVIRRGIVTLVLPPGSPINEKVFCDQLGMSRTPFREALLQLSVENLVTVIPHSGTYVSRIDLQNVFDGQLVRDSLEMKVVRLAALKMTPEFDRRLELNLDQQAGLAAKLDYDGFYELDEAFHSMICAYGASPRIWRIVNGAKAQLDRVRRLAFPVPSHLEMVLAEHAAIAAALKARDPEAAAAKMKLHLDRVFDAIRGLMVERAEYFAPSPPGELDHYEAALRESGADRR